MPNHDTEIVLATRRWIETVVIEHNLCPFAKREFEADRVRIAAVPATTESELVEALVNELLLLSDTSTIETTLVVHPNVLTDFMDYNQFLDIADELLRRMNLEGVIQVASFHPDYQFEGTTPDDPCNYTNRSPYPMLHLLREASLEKAIAATPDIDEIPGRNVETMNRLGTMVLREMFEACISDSSARD